MKIFLMMMIYIYIDSDGRYKLIFTCKSKPSDIYKYIFHIFIESDYNEVNLQFIYIIIPKCACVCVCLFVQVLSENS